MWRRSRVCTSTRTTVGRRSACPLRIRHNFARSSTRSPRTASRSSASTASTNQPEYAMAIRVAIADDSFLIREGILHVLEAVPEIEVVATSTDHEGLLQAIEKENPDIVLTEIR